jgi:predicted phosphodiesterase
MTQLSPLASGAGQRSAADAVPAAAEAPVLAVISDVHANLPALRAVCGELDRRGIVAVLCLGDVVGYGPHPAECLRELRARGIPCLRGNHDDAAASGRLDADLSPAAAAGIRFARARLSRGELRHLAGLPWRWEAGGATFVHASLPQPEEFRYLMGAGAARRHLAAQRAAVSFFGHTHVQGGFRRAGAGVAVLRPEDGAAPARGAFNPGAVGQPRDGDPRAAFLVHDRRTGRVEFGRVAYDWEETAADVRRAGLPEELAQRLGEGW